MFLIYDEGLAQCAGRDLMLPARRPGASHVFHQYVLRATDRDGLQQRLLADGIATNVHYPLPVHLQPADVRPACPGAGKRGLPGGAPAFLGALASRGRAVPLRYRSA